jgi:hypothetical protein
MMVASKIIVGVGVVGIVHYRVFTPFLLPLATNQFAGPFSQPVNQLANLVPTLLLVIVFGTLVWVAIGGLQDERKRDTQVRRGRR